jgi:outer membrane receptor for ferrienterochelin and colicins
MKEMSKLDSPVPVEVYSSNFFIRNPTPSVFESMQNVNGVKPQINCNVCNTGDIHINGLEGPYTMVLIDGMPIVSGLSTVYGLTGIPQALIDRVEVVKGPASTLYGSEAVGGLINVITKDPVRSSKVAADVSGTSWGEVNTDVGIRFNAGEKVTSLIGINYFNFSRPTDKNSDGFTDVALQDRVSFFNKWDLDRSNGKKLSVALRYVYEDRWGGEMEWTRADRGGDEVYGESIYTNRWELFGSYDLPTAEPFIFQFSANGHDQNSVYGDLDFMAEQYIGFGQLLWNRNFRRIHDLMAGASVRYTWYDDNTPVTATGSGEVNEPSVIMLPGIFIQDEISTGLHTSLLTGVRYDHNSIHGSVVTPRLNFKWSPPKKNMTCRLSVGNGYRVANVFTEDHAALTGARDVVFLSDLKPETSWNVNLNVVKKWFSSRNKIINTDMSVFYTHFNNRIIADYETDPQKVIYDNLTGYSVSRGISINMDISWTSGLSTIMGFTLQEVYISENGMREDQLLTEPFSAVWSIRYKVQGTGFIIDYTGNIYAPMDLPLLGDLDPRPSSSPWYSIQNLQISRQLKGGFRVFGGVKNLLDFTPPAYSITRPQDPFDKGVTFDQNGDPVATPDNPHALTFDPTYIYAPNQGIRLFAGVAFTLK